MEIHIGKAACNTIFFDIINKLFSLLPRSPWSNTYFPPLEDGAVPTEKLRKIEIDANMAFDQYREMYFEGGVSSVYLWDLDQGFAGNNNLLLILYYYIS
jgi:hypothetical protein